MSEQLKDNKLIIDYTDEIVVTPEYAGMLGEQSFTELEIILPNRIREMSKYQVQFRTNTEKEYCSKLLIAENGKIKLDLWKELLLDEYLDISVRGVNLDENHNIIKKAHSDKVRVKIKATLNNDCIPDVENSFNISDVLVKLMDGKQVTVNNQVASVSGDIRLTADEVPYDSEKTVKQSIDESGQKLHLFHMSKLDVDHFVFPTLNSVELSYVEMNGSSFQTGVDKLPISHISHSQLSPLKSENKDYLYTLPTYQTSSNIINKTLVKIEVKTVISATTSSLVGPSVKLLLTFPYDIVDATGKFLETKTRFYIIGFSDVLIYAVPK